MTQDDGFHFLVVIKYTNRLVFEILFPILYSITFQFFFKKGSEILEVMRIQLYLGQNLAKKEKKYLLIFWDLTIKFLTGKLFVVTLFTDEVYDSTIVCSCTALYWFYSIVGNPGISPGPLALIFYKLKNYCGCRGESKMNS